MKPIAYVQVATTYRIAFGRCEEQRPLPGGKFEMPLMPGIVCGIFAIELAFKGLLLQRGKSTRVHDLTKLFQQLHPDDRAAIISSCGISNPAFTAKLDEIRDGYVRWRYFFEHAGLSVDLEFVRSLADASIAVAKSKVTA